MDISIIDFFSNLDFDNMKYFYHITEQGSGDKILEEGLLMADKHLWSTTIEITPEMIKDPYNFIKGERGNNIRNTDEMNIIGCEKEDIDYLVTKNDFYGWNQEEDANYIIPRDFIMGYIDMRSDDEDYSLILNPNYFNYGGR